MGYFYLVAPYLYYAAGLARRLALNSFQPVPASSQLLLGFALPNLLVRLSSAPRPAPRPAPFPL